MLPLFSVERRSSGCGPMPQPKDGEIVCQDEEIADAQWFSPDNLPQIPPKTAISGWLIQEFMDRRRAAS